jgi:hypothetical protein
MQTNVEKVFECVKDGSLEIFEELLNELHE